MIGESWQPCLSTDRRAPTSRTSSHYTAYTRCRFVKLSDHICPLSFFIFHLSLKALVTPSPAQQGHFPYPPSTSNRRKETAKRSDKPAAGERSVTDRQSAHVRPAASGSRNNCAESSDSATKRPPPISRSALDAREEKTMLLRSGQQNNFVVDASSSEAPP